ncbi:NUDIX hydrolase [Alicyclobacillus dauci]|uniref:NUDIX domain-containing protein n=1 Tax=Alicyclobacillus dauci TaxID=1475485 RepID=A0ABY6Z9U3_9BACL|nr:NUDIX domain-containing protein [Alicyclobacillus dauci]WAH39029.1 NUDIX domain-containing protein [Alicyclobacillus dauci]
MTNKLKYTMIFIRHTNSLLLLNRVKPPLMGLWTGVGGKIEANESPINGALREVVEETGITIHELSFNGTVKWHTENEDSGMYLFSCEIHDNAGYDKPKLVDEGILAWKGIGWVLHGTNYGIPKHIQLFLPSVLSGEVREHRCVFRNNELEKYEQVPLVHENPAMTQTALITGASSGIGYTYALLSGEKGYDVVIVGR